MSESAIGNADHGRPTRRLGLVGRPSGAWWHQTHCQNPFAQRLSDGSVRVHFAGRDERNRSRAGWLNVEYNSSRFTSGECAAEPSLDIGRLGTFDDSGAMPSSLVESPSGLLLYYTGWTLGGTVPFQFEIGCAVSHDAGRTFERVSEAPVFGRNRFDPLLLGAPWVLKEGSDFRMWYVSGTEWVPPAAGETRPTHFYTIKHAWSADGIRWESDDHLCIPFRDDEYAVARPIVQRTAAGFEMWYSARRHGETYRVYSARSADGLTWIRNNEPLLATGVLEWEREMVCYAAPLTQGNTSLMLYNGNDYGKAGFGAVELPADSF